MYTFLSGALMMGCWVIGLFFLKFHRNSKDFLFKAFGYAFLILGLERLIIVILGIDKEGGAAVYLFRLAAFLLILFAILKKNMMEKNGHSGA